MLKRKRRLSDTMPDGVKMTITQAKKISKEKLGRLPKPGREVLVKSSTRYSIYLQNTSGTYHLRVYYK